MSFARLASRRVSVGPPSLTSASAVCLGSRPLQTASSSRTSNKRVKLEPSIHSPPPYDGPSYDQVHAARQQFMHPSVFPYYQKPLMLVNGKMQYVWDHEGTRFLDCIGGVASISVGHCHPEVVRAGAMQMERLMHCTTLYNHPESAMFCKELAAVLPSHLNRVYLVNSGSEAIDLGVLMARTYTGAYDLVALRNAYHGMSEGARGLTAMNSWRHSPPRGFGISHAACPDVYRGRYGENEPNAGKLYADDVADLIQHICPANPKDPKGAPGAPRLAGFIAESIQGAGGQIVFPDGYVKQVYETVRANGGVCIADEVQTGFGRTGKSMWGFERHGVSPDMVVMAKGIGSGAVLAAVATTDEIAASLTSAIHFNTYAGNPLSATMGRAVLRVIEKEGLIANADARGEQFLEGMRDIQKLFPHRVGQVRGWGLMVGMELVEDPETKAPVLPERMTKVFEASKESGVLLGKAGMRGNVLRANPPLCVTENDIDFALQAMEDGIRAGEQ